MVSRGAVLVFTALVTIAAFALVGADNQDSFEDVQQTQLVVPVAAEDVVFQPLQPSEDEEIEIQTRSSYFGRHYKKSKSHHDKQHKNHHKQQKHHHKQHKNHHKMPKRHSSKRYRLH